MPSDTRAVQAKPQQRETIRRNWSSFVLTGVVLVLIGWTRADGAQKRERGEARKPGPAGHVQPAATSKDLYTTAWDVVATGVVDGKALRRATAIAALSTIEVRPDVVQLVEAGLADKDPDVRLIAAVKLGDMKSRNSIPKLQQALKDSVPEVRFAVARALWAMGDRGGHDVLRDVLAGRRHTSAGLVGRYLREVKKAVHNPMALLLMGVRESADMFGPFGVGIGIVQELANDSGAPGRALAATLLSRDPASVKPLEAALEDKNAVVRAAAAHALADLGSRDSVPKLALLLQDPKDAVRYMAAASLVRLTRENAPRQ